MEIWKSYTYSGNRLDSPFADPMAATLIFIVKTIASALSKDFLFLPTQPVQCQCGPPGHHPLSFSLWIYWLVLNCHLSLYCTWLSG